MKKEKGVISMPFWESTPFWGIISLIASVIVSVVTFLLGKNRIVLEYQIDSSVLIAEETPAIPGLTISLDGQPVTDLRSTTVRFVNKGKKSITRSDFAKNEPLQLKTTGTFFSNCSEISSFVAFVRMHRSNTSSTSNHAEVVSNNRNLGLKSKLLRLNLVSLEFEFLKPKQFFTITLLHSGELSVLGDLISGEKRSTHCNVFMERDRLHLFCIGIPFLSFIFIILNYVLFNQSIKILALIILAVCAAAFNAFAINHN